MTDEKPDNVIPASVLDVFRQRKKSFGAISPPPPSSSTIEYMDKILETIMEDIEDWLFEGEVPIMFRVWDVETSTLLADSMFCEIVHNLLIQKDPKYVQGTPFADSSQYDAIFDEASEYIQDRVAEMLVQHMSRAVLNKTGARMGNTVPVTLEDLRKDLPEVFAEIEARFPPKVT